MKTILLDRLQAEPLTLGHFADVQRLHHDERVMRYLGGTRSEEETKQYFERNLAHWDTYGFGMWVLRDRASGQVAGRGGVRHSDVDGLDEIEMGWALVPSFWARGLGTEIGLACVAFARDVLRSRRVIATAHPENLASINVMRKLGMAFERDVFLHGKDLVLYRVEVEPP